MRKPTDTYEAILFFLFERKSIEEYFNLYTHLGHFGIPSLRKKAYELKKRNFIEIKAGGGLHISFHKSSRENEYQQPGMLSTTPKINLPSTLYAKIGYDGIQEVNKLLAIENDKPKDEINNAMYNDVKQVLHLIKTKGPKKFKNVFKKVVLSPRDQTNLMTFLKAKRIVYNYDGEGNEFGTEPDYALTEYGKQFYDEILDFEALDEILKYLNKTPNFHSIEEICKALNIHFSELFEVRLLDNDMIEVRAQSKDGDSYSISQKGKMWIMKTKGYCQWLILQIDEAGRGQSILKEKPVEPTKQVSYHAETMFVNDRSNIEKQGTSNEEKLKPSKTHWLQVVFWVLTSAVAITSLIVFIKSFLK